MTPGELIEAIVLALILLGCVGFMINKARNLFSEKSSGCNCSSFPDGCAEQQLGTKKDIDRTSLISAENIN